uniref:Transcription factor MYB108-like n=1 Tax=Ananas comosus var. bracteatus TaxID=296719 RepID=A0A6V7PFR7_ANACO|nr:unnamed protein product [Ananas comosus var. bracteatus]
MRCDARSVAKTNCVAWLESRLDAPHLTRRRREKGSREEKRSVSTLLIKQSKEEIMELRRGPWTVDEDLMLINYIANHGGGQWNSLARSAAGLKRTGKSCRLRWLNYLRPDVRRGNITPQEQLLILELHSLWGNKWSKIAQHLPGRTDNEIKNYWRTRVQKHAKQLNCEVNSKKFRDTVRYLWIPRLVERIRAASSSASCPIATFSSSYNSATVIATAAAATRFSSPTVSECVTDCYSGSTSAQGDDAIREESIMCGGLDESIFSQRDYDNYAGLVECNNLWSVEGYNWNF